MAMVILPASELAAKSAKTPELSTVHRPLGTHGLWGRKTDQLPAYIQNIAHAMIRDGHDEGSAIALAVAAVKRWAAGGNHVTPEVRAAAAGALAEWEKLRAEHAGKSSSLNTGIPSSSVYYNSASRVRVSYTAGEFNKLWDPARHPRGFRGEFISPGTMSMPSIAQADPGVKDLSSKGRPDGRGTPDDPIDVQGDLNRALLALAHGKSVRLNQADEVSILASKVNKMGADFKRLGLKMPNIDFGNLTVTGTNLFTAQSKGIPRAKMPQLSGIAAPGSEAARIAGGAGKNVDLTEQFKKDLQQHGVSVTTEMVPASHLRATQTQLKGVSVAGIAQAWLDGVPAVRKMMKEPIFVTRDNYIIDGHHRWAADMVLDAQDGHFDDTPMEVRKVNMDIGAAIPYANDYANRMGIPQQGIEGNTALVQKLSFSAAELSRSSAEELEKRLWIPAHHPRGLHGEFVHSGTDEVSSDDSRDFSSGSDPQNMREHFSPEHFTTMKPSHGSQFVGDANVGDEVSHPLLGRGKITSRSMATVNLKFPNGEERMFPRSQEPGGKEGEASLQPIGQAHATRSALAAANMQSRAYTDTQIKQLSDQVNQLQAELHKNETVSARMDSVTDLIGIAVAVALTFVTGGLSLIIAAPFIITQASSAAPIVAKWINARVGHTENPLTPFLPGEKIAKDATGAISAILASALTKEGLDPTVAASFAAVITARSAAANAAGRFPGSPGFLTASDKQMILRSIDPARTGRITMKASDLLWLT